MPLPSSSEFALPGWARISRLPVALLAALAQLAAAAITFGLGHAAAALGGYALSPAILLALHSVLATLIASAIGLPWWWLPMQLLFAPALVAAFTLSIAPEWFLAAFVVLALVYWSAYRTRVPLYLSGSAVWQALENLVPPNSGAKVLDLGSGLGGPLLHLAARRPDAEFEGIEAAPLPYLVSRMRSLGRANLRFRFGSFWTRKLDTCDLVFTYLSPAAMPQLGQKARREMRPGSVLVSLEFPIPDMPPSEIIQAGEGPHGRLYLWRF